MTFFSHKNFIYNYVTYTSVWEKDWPYLYFLYFYNSYGKGKSNTS